MTLHVGTEHAGRMLISAALCISAVQASPALAAGSGPGGAAPDGPPASVASARAETTKQEKSMESAKRRIPKVTPLQIGAVRYEALKAARARGFAQNGGVLAAVDAASGKELWTLLIYTTAYEPHEESDAQDRYITKISASQDGQSLLIESENKKRYTVRLADRSVSVLP